MTISNKNHQSWLHQKAPGEIIINGKWSLARLHCEDQEGHLFNLENGEGEHYAFQAGAIQKIYIQQNDHINLVFRSSYDEDGFLIFEDLRVGKAVNDDDPSYIKSLDKLQNFWLDLNQKEESEENASEFTKMGHIHRWSI